MAHVTVTIAGRTYRMACAEGEEAHLSGLAAAFDARVERMRASFGAIGDMRLHVMAALTLCDELAEAEGRAAAAVAEAAALREAAEASEIRISAGIERTAERIERLTRTLSAPAGALPEASPRDEGQGDGRPDG